MCGPVGACLKALIKNWKQICIELRFSSIETKEFRQQKYPSIFHPFHAQLNKRIIEWMATEKVRRKYASAASNRKTDLLFHISNDGNA